MAYRMILNETSYFGAGSISQIVDEVKKRGFKKALVVTDKDLIKFKVATKVTQLLDNNGFSYQVFDEVMPNPTISIVQKGVEVFKQSGADYLIAIGGGSPQDTAKAIGIIINNPEFADVRSLEGVAPTKKPAVPTIAIPTTAGTAAEVTINYVITDEENKRKFVCVDPHDIPAVAIIDSDMMTSMPASLKAATGVDALTHAIEGYITKGAWELSDMFHLKAIEIISRSLRDSVRGIAKGSEDMALGQYIAGMGFSNVGLGLVHGMAHPLGAFYGTPHGVANAVLLPHIMAYNAEFTGEKYRDIAKAMGVALTENMTIEQVRKAAVDAVKQLNVDVGIPATLKEIGVKLDDIPALAQAAFDDVCTGGNPRDTNVREIEQLYHSIYQ
ncbi:lactaldehyde reductase [Gilliamella apis]|uniref:lactaldehyde reductase n=1 Tax=Gilliamella apis TaxID=1970738 RepID=UPI000A34F271|nr:lactaldehyde reductase [Gilliamella apis]OTQ56501.1 lactaldehyde reductase [Gilliamella apis]